MAERIDEDGNSICPIVHGIDPDQPRKSSYRSPLCKGHEKKLDGVLEALSHFDRDADEVIEAGTARHDSAPLTGNPEKSLIIDLDGKGEARAATLRIEVREKLASWAGNVADDRNITRPAITKTALFIRKHYDYVLAADWVVDFATEMLWLGFRTQRFLEPTGNRQFTIGECFEEDTEGYRCRGVLWAWLTPADPYAEAKSFFECDLCGHLLYVKDWLPYGDKVKQREAA